MFIAFFIFTQSFVSPVPADPLPTPSVTTLEWPPMKVFIYPNTSRHTSDCIYPPEKPLRYVDEKNFWWQRMLEPTVHFQLLESQIVTEDPETADVFLIPHYSRMCSGLDGGKRW
jgi:hypothetical protein